MAQGKGKSSKSNGKDKGETQTLSTPYGTLKIDVPKPKKKKPKRSPRRPRKDRSNSPIADNDPSDDDDDISTIDDTGPGATGVTFGHQEDDDGRFTGVKEENEEQQEPEPVMKREKSILKKEPSSFDRENTRLERENTKHTRFAAIERERTDFTLRSRPGTSLDGQLVDYVDCTGSDDDYPPQFDAGAVLKGETAANTAKYDPDNARKPFMGHSFDKRRKDSIVIWPFGNGTITLPKPPPRQPRPPTILESPGPEDKWVRINIGGALFHTRISTLSRCPGSRLTNLVYNDVIPDDVEREYRFDRSPMLFAYILDYYRSGYLHMPQDVCAKALRYELQFWRLPDSVVAPCCWETYSRPAQDDSVAKELEAADPPFYVDTKCCGSETCRRQLWLMLEFPSSSWYAKLWAFIYILLVIASIACLILDTVRSCRVSARDSARVDPTETNVKQIMLNTTDSHPAIVILEIITTLFFSVDLVFRFYCSSPYRKFISLLNTAEFLSITSEWILLFLIAFTSYWDSNVLMITYKVCSFIRVLRVVRLFRLARSYRGLRVFLLAMAASVRELLLLVVLLFMGVVIFATMIYYAEFSDPNNNFPDIPFSFWWSVITMTTVGYGDVFPQSALGYAVGALCAVTGMLATGLPIPIIATNFQMYYSYSKIKARLQGRNKEEPPPMKGPKGHPVRLPQMKTMDMFQSTFIDGLSRSSTKTYDNESFSRCDSGVFDDQMGEEKFVDRKDRPRAAAKEKPSTRAYSKLREDSVISDADPPRYPPRSDTLFSTNYGTRDTTMISLGRTKTDLLAADTDGLPDVGSSSPRYPKRESFVESRNQ